jgi:hypothetical protein
VDRKALPRRHFHRRCGCLKRTGASTNISACRLPLRSLLNHEVTKSTKAGQSGSLRVLRDFVVQSKLGPSTSLSKNDSAHEPPTLCNTCTLSWFRSRRENPGKMLAPV